MHSSPMIVIMILKVLRTLSAALRNISLHSDDLLFRLPLGVVKYCECPAAIAAPQDRSMKMTSMLVFAILTLAETNVANDFF